MTGRIQDWWHRRSGLVMYLLVVLTVAGAVLGQGYNGRKDLRDSQIKGCERAKLDRSANALGWRNAQRARQKAGEWDVAVVYWAIATGLEARSRIDCAAAFPEPSLLP